MKVNKFFQLFLFALPAHEVVESVIPLAMLFFRQANCLAASSADLFVTLLHLIRVVHVFHNFFLCCAGLPPLAEISIAEPQTIATPKSKKIKKKFRPKIIVFDSNPTPFIKF